MNPLVIERLKNMNKAEALEFAKFLCHGEKASANNVDPYTPAIFMHRNKYYFGGIQHIVPAHREIVLCSRTSYVIPTVMVEAIKDVSPRNTYRYDDELTLGIRQDILQLTGVRLHRLDPSLTAIAEEKMKGVNIIEVRPNL